MKKIPFLLTIATIFSCTSVFADTFNYTPQNRVRVMGEAQSNQTVTMTLVKKGAENITPSDIGYISQAKADENNRYNFDFTFKKDISEYDVMVRQGDKVISDTVDIAESKLEAVNAEISVDMDISEGATVAEISAQMRNYFFDDLEYQMLLAFYDNTKKLIAVKMVKDGLLPYDEYSTSHSEPIPDNTAFIKGFVMSSDYEPLGIAQERDTSIVKQYYVSTSGSDSDDGSTKTPLKTLDKAVKLASNYADTNNLTEGTISIILENGTYRTEDGTQIGNFKFGDTKLEITAKEGDTVKLTNAKELNVSFDKVEDENILNRLPDSSVDLYVADLSDIITEYGDLEKKDGNTTNDRKIDFYLDGEPLTLARYPNEGYMPIADGDVITGSNYKEDGTGDTVATFTSGAYRDRIKKWTGAEDLRIYGFLAKGWYDSYTSATVSSDGYVTLDNYPQYGVNSSTLDGRFYAYNLLEEIDMPGEYYVDRENNLLYICPPNNWAMGKIEYVNKPQEFDNNIEKISNVLQIYDCENVSVKNIEVYGNIGTGISVSAYHGSNPSKNINIENCRIYSVSGTGVDFAYWRCEDSKIHGCEITKTGSYGIDANLGDTNTLHSANVVIENNHIFDYAVYNKGYRPAIHMNGVGITARNNLIHNAPHMAIHYTGHNMKIENNYIYDVMEEIDDSGAIYTGRNWLGTNYITGNVIRDCSGYGDAIMGIYIDDLGSGANIKNNLIMNMKSGVALAGGIYNSLEDNIFVNLNSAYGYNARGVEGYSDDVIETLRTGVQSKMGNQAYVSEFSFITTLLEKEPEKTLGSKVSGNVVSACDTYTVADLVKERNEISEPVVYDEMSVTVAADGSIAISGADEETLKKAEAIKNAGLTGGGNYTLPDFTAQN